jgi:type I restriction enzyme, S subunit
MMRNTNTKPVLRFPEFKEDWKFKFGNEVFEPISNKNHNSDLPILAISQEFGAVPRELINYQISVTEQSISTYKVVDIGDFIISLRSFQGGIEYSNYKGICSPAYIVLRPKIEIENKFFKYYLKTYNYIQKLQRTLEGIRDGKMISYKYFSEIKLPLPSQQEQKKIADFLIQIDSRIIQLTEKKENLEQYKKGITQRIFTQKLRFKDEKGKDFPAWEKFKLGDLTVKVGAKNKKNEQLPIYSISNKKGFVPQSNQFEGLDSIERGFDITLYKIIEEKTYAYNPARINVGSIGYSGELNRVLVSSLYVCFKTKKNVCDDFFNHYLDSYQFNKSVLRSTEGGVRQYLFYENFSLIVLNLPTIKEQEKIASFLNQLSQQLSLVNEQLEETRTFKKALLSKLFV